MRKWMILALLAAGAVGLARLASRREAEGSRPTIWDKLGAQMEEMPEDFPPRVMFDNVAKTNETTQKILNILEEKGAEEEPGLIVAGHSGND
ncbi:MAG: hypothetical protein OES13_04195 [Acidimicrobiia bacterium]|nr:hypothetical protein [Acidimicrobiia bacterium]